jgi:N-acetylneuraminate synthase
MEDIECAVNIFRDNDCPFELIHDVSTYPMKDTDTNYRNICFKVS